MNSDVEEIVRQCEIVGIRSAVETAGRAFPHLEATSLEVAGGLAAFTGSGSALSQVYGLGAAGPVGRDDIDRITAFYEFRDATPRVFVAESAHPSLASSLAEAGYTPVEWENVLVSDDVRTHAQRDERIAPARDINEWALASAEGFRGDNPEEQLDDFIARMIVSPTGVLALEARDGDEIVATAVMHALVPCASLFAGSTLRPHRGRGWHIALIRDRIARAQEAGATLMRATAKAESISERNFARCGFVTLHTRALWERNAIAPLYSLTSRCRCCCCRRHPSWVELLAGRASRSAGRRARRACRGSSGTRSRSDTCPLWPV